MPDIFGAPGKLSLFVIIISSSKNLLGKDHDIIISFFLIWNSFRLIAVLITVNHKLHMKNIHA